MMTVTEAQGSAERQQEERIATIARRIKLATEQVDAIQGTANSLGARLLANPAATIDPKRDGEAPSGTVYECQEYLADLEKAVAHLQETVADLNAQL